MQLKYGVFSLLAVLAAAVQRHASMPSVNQTTQGACPRPAGWCSHSRSAYVGNVDCDGDGIADPYCQDTGTGHSGVIGSASSCTDSWAVNGACAGVHRVPIYRYYSGSDHFYSKTAAAYPGYTYEGIAFYAYNMHSTHTVPIFRSYYAAGTDHLYSQSSSEGPNAGFAAEGVEFYASASQQSGTSVPIYRSWNPTIIDHFYSQNSAEGTNSGWTPEGIAFYAYSHQVDPTPQPTPAPTPTPTQAPHDCKSWCAADTREWTTKCQWNVCHHCDDCGNRDQCQQWCYYQTDDWTTKCSWRKACSGCGPCQ